MDIFQATSDKFIFLFYFIISYKFAIISFVNPKLVDFKKGFFIKWNNF